MDPTSRGIVVSLGVVLLLVLASLASAILIPFDVEHTAMIESLDGAGVIIQDDRLPIELDTTNMPKPLLPGETLRIEADSAAQISFELSGGQVIMTGPAALSMKSAVRHATALGHIIDTDHFRRTYTLVLRHNEGRGHYDFSHSYLPFEEIDILLQLPGQNFKPTSHCWDISVENGVVFHARDVDCTTRQPPSP